MGAGPKEPQGPSSSAGTFREDLEAEVAVVALLDRGLQGASAGAAFALALALGAAFGAALAMGMGL